jgi:hypothetical protein
LESIVRIGHAKKHFFYICKTTENKARVKRIRLCKNNIF